MMLDLKSIKFLWTDIRELLTEDHIICYSQRNKGSSLHGCATAISVFA